MFTGIIQTVGTLRAVDQRGGDCRLQIAGTELPADALELGASIAVNGVCLTVIESDGNGFSADLSRETLQLTTAGRWQIGQRLNLEPALQLSQRLGGHLVSGHVDGVGTVQQCQEDARSVRFALQAPKELGRFVAQKGSISVDGTSLTVNKVSGALFEINTVPHTLSHTIMADYGVGTEVNLEVDLLARYLERMLQADGESGSATTMTSLRSWGYE